MRPKLGTGTLRAGRVQCVCGHPLGAHHPIGRGYRGVRRACDFCGCRAYRVPLPVPTHYVRWDQPRRRTAKQLRAVCGEPVPRKLWSGEPTCLDCKAWVEEYEHLVLD
jgi:hypothetical protein